MKLSTVFRKYQVVESEQKKVVPTPPMAITKNSRFVYSKGSDVMKTFKRYGFTPPSEYRNDYLFKKNREMSNE